MTYKVKVISKHTLKYVRYEGDGDVTLLLNDGEVKTKMRTIQSRLVQDLFPMAALNH